MLFRSPPVGRLILVLGGMRELGPDSASAHAELIRSASELLPDALCLTVGPEFAGLSTNHFENAEVANGYLASIVRPGDTVFAKGSRGNAVEMALPPEAR